MTLREIRLGTRGSRLAMAQAQTVVDAIARHSPEVRVAVEPIVTEGDEGLPSQPPARGGSKALFTGRLQGALRAHRIDVAVHSMKDLPAGPVAGLAIAAVPVREEPRDALLTVNGRTLQELSNGFRVGTGSLRRGALLRAARPDVVIEPIRGNVDTRIRSMNEKGLDALVLAAAGLRRLGREQLISELLPPSVMLPSPGQGALAVQVRAGDDDVMGLLRGIDDWASRKATEAERALAFGLGSDCNVPVGALADVVDDRLRLEACVASPDGSTVIRRALEGSSTEAQAVGARLAQRLLDDGAAEILSGPEAT